MLQKLYDHVVRSANADTIVRGLTFSLFVELLDHVAQNCLYSSKTVYGAANRVRTMFHVMNSSRGRMKLSKGTNASIIPPLTGLDSTDPTLPKPAGVMPVAKARSPAARRCLSQSPAKPPDSRRRMLDRKKSSSEPSTPEYAADTRSNGALSAGSSKASGGGLHNGGARSHSNTSNSRTSSNHRANGRPDWV